MKANPHDALTIKEFSVLLNVHVNTVRNGIRSGRIQAFRTGDGTRSHFRIYRFELERLAVFDAREMIENIVKERLKEIK